MPAEAVAELGPDMAGRWEVPTGSRHVWDLDAHTCARHPRGPQSAMPHDGIDHPSQSLLTHEFGHFVGLGHVVERGGNDLTMSPAIASCNNSAAVTVAVAALTGVRQHDHLVFGQCVPGVDNNAVELLGEGRPDDHP